MQLPSDVVSLIPHKRQQQAQKAMDAITGKGLPGRGEEAGGKVVRLNIPETLLPALEYVAQVAKAAETKNLPPGADGPRGRQQ